jgi:hypothetical protein
VGVGVSVGIGVSVGTSEAVGDSMGVSVGEDGTSVLVCVAAGISIAACTLTGPPGPTSEISSNQMSPVGEPSVIKRRVTLVFDPLFHVPLRNCQLPETLVHNCVSPTMSAISMQALPVEFVRQI